MARTQYQLAAYAEAVVQFDKLLNGFPTTVYIDNGFYYKGRSQFALKDYTNAIV